MTIYFGILEGSADNWGVWFPDRPGCVAAGGSADEAVDNAASVLALFAELDRKEGLVPPPARSIVALRDDPDVQESLGRGSRIVGFDTEEPRLGVKVGA